MAELPPESGPLPVSLSRRGFLKRTAAGTAFLIVARIGFRTKRARAAGDFSPKLLDADRFATLEAFCDRVISPAKDAPTARQVRLALRIDHEIGLQGPAVARDVRDSLALIEYSGFLEGKFRPFSRLGPEDQEDVLRAMMQSRLTWRRSAFLGLKQLTAFYYYADSRAWKRTGYDGPWVPRRIAVTERDFPFPDQAGGLAPGDHGRSPGRLSGRAGQQNPREKT